MFIYFIIIIGTSESCSSGLVGVLWEQDVFLPYKNKYSRPILQYTDCNERNLNPVKMTGFRNRIFIQIRYELDSKTDVYNLCVNITGVYNLRKWSSWNTLVQLIETDFLNYRLIVVLIKEMNLASDIFMCTEPSLNLHIQFFIVFAVNVEFVSTINSCFFINLWRQIGNNLFWKLL